MIKNNYEHTIIPLPFITPPPVPRQSFSDGLQRSTFLFPKTLSSPRMMNNDNCFKSCSDAKLSSKGAANKKTNCIVPEQVSSRSELTSTSKKEKAVRFNTTDFFHYLDSPAASDMCPREKQKVWYSSNEYDQFKYGAAKHADVKIVRYDSEKPNQSHHFAMMGDFDSKEGTVVKVGNSGLKTDGKASDTGKFYYNENEYKDHTNERGEVICKRGLGYHFSRNRKKSRLVTRSAVIAWQKTLLEQQSKHHSNTNTKVQQNIPTARSINKTEVMLELVSTKCSRVARQEAKWRGNVDYRVAYPERHDPKLLIKSSHVMDKRFFSSDNNNSASATKKRLSGDIDISMNSYNKRQRTSGGGCVAARDDLSPATIRAI